MAKKGASLLIPPIEMFKLVAKGEYKKFPSHYLDKETIKTILRYVLYDIYSFSRAEILRLNHKFFQNNYLGGARKFFNGIENDMLIYSFPELDLKHWEFIDVPNGFWADVKNRNEFVLWVLEREGISIRSKEHLRTVSAKLIHKYGGVKPLKYAGGLYNLLNDAAGGIYKKWEITTRVSWTKEDIVPATKWLIEEKLKLTPAEVCKLKVEDFERHHLDSMLQKVCNHSILNALEATYPGRYYRIKSRGICYKE